MSMRSTSKMLSMTIVFVLFVLAMVKAETTMCPERCTCPSQYSVVCSDIPTGQAPGIKHLTITGDEHPLLSDSVFRKLPQLEKLVVTRVGLKTLEGECLAGLNSLTHLVLSLNDLETLPDKVFVKVTQLVNLNLSNNKLTTVPTALKVLSNLKVLDLAGNQIKAILPNIVTSPFLEVVDFSGNRLGTIASSSFPSLNRLLTLKLNKCGIDKLDEDVLAATPALSRLELRDNELVSIDSIGNNLSGMKSLRYLDISGCNIDRILNKQLDGLYLFRLDLSRNRVVNIESDAFKNVSINELIIEDNLLTFDSIKKTTFPDVRTLSLAGNNLTKFSSSALPKSLRNLHLSRTNLTSFPTEILRESNLDFLDISYNGFKSLGQENVKLLHDIDVVDLSGDFWECNCFLKHLYMWLRERGYSQQSCDADGDGLQQSDRVNCVRCGPKPSKYTGRLLVDLSMDELEQCYYNDKFPISHLVMISAGLFSLLFIVIFVIFNLIKWRRERVKKRWNVDDSGHVVSNKAVAGDDVTDGPVYHIESRDTVIANVHTNPNGVGLQTFGTPV